MYGRAGYLGHLTRTILIFIFGSPILKSLQNIINLSYIGQWFQGRRGGRTTADDGRMDVRMDGPTTGEQTDNGCRSHRYTLSSSVSLRLSWAKKGNTSQS